MTQSVCPHCGKPLANPEKLAWHLSRECPVFAATAGVAKTPGSGDDSSQHPER